MSSAQFCSATRGWISFDRVPPPLVWVTLLLSVTVVGAVSKEPAIGVDVPTSVAVLVKVSPVAVGSPASAPPVYVVRIRAWKVMVAVPL